MAPASNSPRGGPEPQTPLSLESASAAPNEGPSAPPSQNVREFVEDSALRGSPRSRARVTKKRANDPRGSERRPSSPLGDPARMKSCGELGTPIGCGVEDSARAESEASLVSNARRSAADSDTVDSNVAPADHGSPGEASNVALAGTDVSTNGEQVRKRGENAYNKFCRDHKELGLSCAGLSELYKKAVAGSYIPSPLELSEWRAAGKRFTCTDDDFMASAINFSVSFSRNPGPKPKCKPKPTIAGEAGVEDSAKSGDTSAEIVESTSICAAEKQGDEGASSAVVVGKDGCEVESQDSVGSKPSESEEQRLAANDVVEEQVQPDPRKDKPKKSDSSSRKPNRWNAFQSMFSGWDGQKVKEAYAGITKAFNVDVVDSILGTAHKGDLDGEKMGHAAKMLQSFKDQHEADLAKIAKLKKEKAGCNIHEGSDESLSPEEIRVRDLARMFRKPKMDLRKQNREKLPHDHDRLFKDFSAWMLVSPTTIRKELPAEQGVYEWGFKIPKGKEITCFYLGKAMNLRVRLMKYIDSKQNRVVGPKEDQDGIKQKYFQELSAQGCSFYVRLWRTMDAQEVEGWLLGQVNYGLNKVKNGEKRPVEMEGGQHFPDVDFNRTEQSVCVQSV